jgi:hypothetical protein
MTSGTTVKVLVAWRTSAQCVPAPVSLVILTFSLEMLKAKENEVYHHPPYIQTPSCSRPESVHEIRSCEYSNSDYGLLMTPLQGSTDIFQVATISGTSLNQASMEYLCRRQQVVLGGKGGNNLRKETSFTPSHQLEYRENT